MCVCVCVCVCVFVLIDYSEGEISSEGKLIQYCLLLALYLSVCLSVYDETDEKI